MIILLLKYSLLFLSALLLGVLLGRWWIRRGFIDVTDSYAAMAAEQPKHEGAWERLWSRLDLLDGGIEPKLHSALTEHPNQSLTEAERLANNARLDAMAQSLGQMEKQLTVTAEGTREIAAMMERISDLERYVRTLPRTHHQLDLSPIKYRLAGIEENLKTRRAARAKVQTAERRAKPPARNPKPRTSKRQKPKEPVLLGTSAAKTRDDLQQILGIGRTLEQRLNKIGVYYYWQIASWSAADIQYMDHCLDTIKGRISRDHWVAQAQRLQSRAGAAAAPG